MKKTIVVIALLALLLSACGTKPTSGEQQAAEPFQTVRHAEITVRDYGTIKLELDEGSAPITVANFIKLAKAYGIDAMRVDGKNDVDKAIDMIVSHKGICLVEVVVNDMFPTR